MVDVFEKTRREIQRYVLEEGNQTVGLPTADVARMITCYMNNARRRVFDSFGGYVSTLRQKEKMWPQSDIGKIFYFRDVAEGVCNGFALMNVRAKESSALSLKRLLGED